MPEVPHVAKSARKFHFISGMPRSGSTLLAAILNQNPRFRSGMTSPLADIMGVVMAETSSKNDFSFDVSDEQRVAMLRGLVENFYAGQADAGVRLSRVEVLDQAAQHGNTLLVGDVERKIVLAARLRHHHPHDVGQRAGHARTETRILVEDGGQERAARARHPGNEVELASWLRDVEYRRHAVPLLWIGAVDGIKQPQPGCPDDIRSGRACGNPGESPAEFNDFSPAKRLSDSRQRPEH